MVVLVGLLIIVIAGPFGARRPWRANARETPLVTLKSRFAWGEIDEQEFQRGHEAVGRLRDAFVKWPWLV